MAMHNICKLFVSDLRHLFANVTSIIIALGLVLLPSIFTWYNVLACWDVFKNTGNLTVAVANVDEGYQSDLVPLRVNIGEQVVSALRANEDIDWTFTTQEDAVDGAAAGRYYAAVVIPEQFSCDMLTFYTDDVEHADIVYYSNEKKSAIAPKVTDQGADTVSYQVNKVFAQTLSEVSVSVAQALSSYADKADVNSQVAALSGNVRRMADRTDQASSVVGLYASLVRASQGALEGSDDLIGQVEGSANGISDTMQRSIDTALSDAQKVVDSYSKAAAEVGVAKEWLDKAGITPAEIASFKDQAQKLQDLSSGSEAIKDAEADLEAYQKQYDAEVKPALTRMESQLKALQSNAKSMADRLAAAGQGLSGVIGGVNDRLGQSASNLDTMASRLSAAAASLRQVADKIDAALTSQDGQVLKDILSADSGETAVALSSPVSVERNAVFATENFGSAMTPLYTTLALFIGALLIMVCVKPFVSQRALDDLGEDANPKHYQLFLGRYGVVGLLAFLQSTLLALGNLLFLQAQAVHPFLFLVCFWVTGQVFAFIIYTLVASFANLGKAITVLLLIVQVTGCNGSFPMQLMPGFIQAISPWLPATHVVAAMRAAMMGVYANDFWIEMGTLCLFAIPFAVLGLALSGPLSKFMKWYIKRVEDSKLMA